MILDKKNTQRLGWVFAVLLKLINQTIKEIYVWIKFELPYMRTLTMVTLGAQSSLTTQLNHDCVSPQLR